MSNISSTPPPEYGPIIVVPPQLFAPAPEPPPRPPRRWINALLFVLTAGSTVVAGTYLAHFDQDLLRFWAYLKYHPELLLDGIPFSVTLLSILGAHELGHYLLSRHHRVDSTLPYFLPGPTLVGTFGAVIFMRSPIPNRKALFDIGAAGPLMGLVVAVLAAGIGLATAKPELYFPELDTRGLVMFSPNLLLALLDQIIHMPEIAGADMIPNAKQVWSSPFLDAAMIGFLVTALNLLPVGQLDGGHISHAVFGRRSIYLSLATLGTLAVGARFWPPWIFFVIFLVLLMGARGIILLDPWLFLQEVWRGFNHPPPVDPDAPLGPARTVLAVVILILLALIISPVPVGIDIGGWGY